MKKSIAMVLALSMCFALTACRSYVDTSAPYSAYLGNDTYYNIAADSNVLPHSPVVVSDEENIGDVFIRVLDGDGQLVGSVKTVSPGESVILDEIPTLSGICTIQGKAADVSGTYTLYIE